MPESTVNWLWIGNRPVIDSTPASNVTQTQLNAAGMPGYSVTGPARIAPVAVTGTTTASGGAQVFTAPFNAVGGFVSQFSFDSPTTPGTVTGQTIQTTFRGDITITLPDGSTTNQVATIVQMANGDLFLRPNAQFLPAWSGIDSLRSITINQATPFPSNTVLNSVISFNPDIFDIVIPCFTAGTRIATPDGTRRVEDLQVGDLVLTADHGPQPIRWIGRRDLTAADLQAAPQLCPIRIAPGALGAGQPATELRVSPQHRMLVRSRIANRLFDSEEVLVAARHLTGLPGIGPCAAEPVSYLHLLLDRHEILFANGAPTESLYPGPVALQALGAAAVSEILALFPELDQSESPGLAPARILVRGRQGRSMAARHRKHATPLIAA
ncbi:Hint domain-containing protein [Gemmobacter denitrificans]|uniref:Hint domain-containing protein n=1 Tax=Gemmobacter denitrificans TaxID=3123040 RepID=A0ABU8BRQ8_9RHOB